MTYLFHQSQIDELSARMEYLYRVFHTYFIRMPDEHGFIRLESFPFANDKIYMITGHNTDVHRVLSKISQAETVIINSCFPEQFTCFLQKHKIYFCKTDSNGYARPRYGEKYGMGFDPLDSELLLLRSGKKSVVEKVSDAYDILKEHIL